ncbi:extensin family protein [Bosea sp. 117]|uniref:extensin-like domain-containing protein n=1 Tax=Bosea sp. 117 TaxID=1125973 RepID=UPI0018CC0136|nr:extensin family protein [Bosea sp. 117]
MTAAPASPEAAAEPEEPEAGNDSAPAPPSARMPARAPVPPASPWRATKRPEKPMEMTAPRLALAPSPGAVPLPPPRPGPGQSAALTPGSRDAAPAAGEEREAAIVATAPPPASSAPASPPAGAALGACPALAAGDLAVFEAASVEAKGGCGIENPVRLSAVRMASGRLVPLEPAAVLRCDMAAAVVQWLREDIDPLVATLGSPLDKVLVADSYSCRPRNRVAGAKLSEHGRGNAIDTRGYRLENGREYVVGGKGAQAMPVAFQEKLKTSACTHFTTILGPGSDGYHELHLHVDRTVRRTSAALCRWTVKAATP